MSICLKVIRSDMFLSVVLYTVAISITIPIYSINVIRIIIHFSAVTNQMKTTKSIFEPQKWHLDIFTQIVYCSSDLP